MTKDETFRKFLNTICENSNIDPDFIYFGKVLTEDYHINALPLFETTLTRIFEKHANEGFFIISACKKDNTPKENEIETERLKQSLQVMDYSYIPVGGGYIHKNGDVAIEDSFMCFAQDPVLHKKMQYTFLRKMLQDAVALCNEYDQESVLVNIPGEDPKYIDKRGNVVNQFNGVKFNDMNNRNFTKVSKGKHVDRRFSYIHKDNEAAQNELNSIE